MDCVEVLNYWYSDRIRKHWFSSTKAVDKEITYKFEAIWEKAIQGELQYWMQTPECCLALVIVFDQFPLNMYRGRAKSFQSEQLAIEACKYAIAQNFQMKINVNRLQFLFMPLMHSENLEDQDLSVKLYKEFKLENNIRFAEHHRNIIKKYGRFPHRNEILGRNSTAEELDYLKSKNAFLG